MTHPANLPFIPPGEDELPHTDGEPMESDRHRKQMDLLIDSLDYALRDRDDVHVGGNIFIYFSELQTKHNVFEVQTCSWCSIPFGANARAGSSGKKRGAPPT